MPWNINTNTIEIAPSPKATGAPDNSIASVTSRTIVPWVVGVTARALRWRASRWRLGREVERRVAPGHERCDVDRVLQRQQPKTDRHRGVRNPQARAPHRVRHPALIPRLFPEQERQ